MKNFLAIVILHLFLAPSLFSQTDEYGIASYYADQFHGKKTASGELYDKNKMTGAHKTLPFGTLVKVTRLDNKKSVQVRITDRGPFISGRIIDVSRIAAEKLGLVKDGQARVKLEVLGKQNPAMANALTKTKNQTRDSEKNKSKSTASPSVQKEKRPVKKEKKPLQLKTEKISSKASLVQSKNYQPYDLYQVQLLRPDKKGFGVQVSAYTDFENVFKEIADLQGKWFKNILLSVENGGLDGTVYKILLGPFGDKASAENYKDSLKKKNISGFIVDLENINYVN